MICTQRERCKNSRGLKHINLQLRITRYTTQIYLPSQERVCRGATTNNFAQAHGVGITGASIGHTQGFGRNCFFSLSRYMLHYPGGVLYMVDRTLLLHQSCLNVFRPARCLNAWKPACSHPPFARLLLWSTPLVQNLSKGSLKRALIKGNVRARVSIDSRE